MRTTLHALPLMLSLGLSGAALADSPAPGLESSDVLPAPTSLPLTVSYFGETLARPGLRLATELTVARLGEHRLFVEPALGGYFHRAHSLGLFAESLIGYRHAFGPRFRMEALVGVGYLHTFVDGTMYEARGTSTPSAVTNLGRPSVMPSAAVSFRWNLGREANTSPSLFVRPRVFWQAPYNQGSLMHAAVEAGFTLPVSL
jgi:hypothetical protein